MKSRYIFFKENFFKIFFFSLFLTIISSLYDHYGWAVTKGLDMIEIGLFSTKEEGSIHCGGLPLPYVFDWQQVVGMNEGHLIDVDTIFYQSIFYIDIVLWMIILTLLFSWLKERKSKEISKKEDKK